MYHASGNAISQIVGQQSVSHQSLVCRYPLFRLLLNQGEHFYRNTFCVTLSLEIKSFQFNSIQFNSIQKLLTVCEVPVH